MINLSRRFMARHLRNVRHVVQQTDQKSIVHDDIFSSLKDSYARMRTIEKGRAFRQATAVQALNAHL